MSKSDIPDVSDQFSVSADLIGPVDPRVQFERERSDMMGSAASRDFSRSSKLPIGGESTSRVSVFIYKDPDDSPDGAGEVFGGLTLRF